MEADFGARGWREPRWPRWKQSKVKVCAFPVRQLDMVTAVPGIRLGLIEASFKRNSQSVTVEAKGRFEIRGTKDDDA
jgi:hypothetical protein